MKKAISLIIIIFLVACALPYPSAQASYDALMSPLVQYSQIAYVLSLEDGTVLYEKNIEETTAPASLTKLVTALVVFNNCANLQAVVTVPESAIEMISGTNSSNAGLKAGEEITVMNLLYCMLVPSANEAAIVLADFIGSGSIDNFVTMMNELATQIGCKNTHFVNPHGLDEEGQYTTAYDMSLITRYALSFEYSDVFEKITSTKVFTLPKSNMNDEKVLRTTNYLMNSGYAEYYCKYVTGLKTGSTDNAGKCVVARASFDGYSYLVVMMKASFDDIDSDGYRENGAFIDAKCVFEWVFDNIRYETVLSASQIVCEIPVALSTQTDYVALMPEQELSAFVPTGTGEQSVLVETDPDTMPESLDAPVEKGQAVGQAVVYYAGQEIARVQLIAAQEVERNFFLYLLSLVRLLFSKLLFKILFTIIVLLVATYVGIRIYGYRKNKQRRNALRMVNYRNIKK